MYCAILILSVERSHRQTLALFTSTAIRHKFVTVDCSSGIVKGEWYNVYKYYFINLLIWRTLELWKFIWIEGTIRWWKRVGYTRISKGWLLFDVSCKKVIALSVFTVNLLRFKLANNFLHIYTLVCDIFFSSIRGRDKFHYRGLKHNKILRINMKDANIIY